MTPRDNPEHVIIVEWDVPLDVARPVSLHVELQPLQRRIESRTCVPVPASGTAVANGTAHQEHCVQADVASSKELAACTPGLGKKEVESVGGGLVNQLVEDQAGLVMGLPDAAGRVVRPTVASPNLSLPVYQCLIAGPETVQLGRRDDIAQDDIALLLNFIGIDLDSHYSTPLCVDSTLIRH